MFLSFHLSYARYFCRHIPMPPMPMIPVQSTDGLLKRHVKNNVQWITAKPSTMPRQGSVRIPLCASQPSLPRIWKIRLSSPWVAGSYCSWNRWTLDFSEVGATWEVKEMNKSTGRRSGPLMCFLQRKERFSKRPTVPLSWHLNQLLFCLVIPGEGLCLIIENVENEVDPMLDPVLDKQIIKKGSLVQRSWLRWGILKDQVQWLKGNWDLVILHSHKPSDFIRLAESRIWVKCFEHGWPSGCTHLNFPESQGKNKYINVSDQNMDYKVPKLGMRRYSWLKVWAV